MVQTFVYTTHERIVSVSLSSSRSPLVSEIIQTRHESTQTDDT